SPYYYCLIEQLKRIPTQEEKTVYDELSPMRNIILCYGDHKVMLSSSLKLSSRLYRLYKIWQFSRQFIPRKELLFMGSRLIKYVFSTPTQRKKLDPISYVDWLRFDREHPLVKLIEAISAVDANGSALMCVDQMYRQILGVFNPHHLPYTTNYFSKPASD